MKSRKFRAYPMVVAMICAGIPPKAQAIPAARQGIGSIERPGLLSSVECAATITNFFAAKKPDLAGLDRLLPSLQAIGADNAAARSEIGSAVQTAAISLLKSNLSEKADNISSQTQLARATKMALLNSSGLKPYLSKELAPLVEQAARSNLKAIPSGTRSKITRGLAGLRKALEESGGTQAAGSGSDLAPTPVAAQPVTQQLRSTDEQEHDRDSHERGAPMGNPEYFHRLAEEISSGRRWAMAVDQEDLPGLRYYHPELFVDIR